MQSTEILMNEHENIRRLLHVIRNAQLHIMNGNRPDTDDFLKFVDFIRLYADQTHHGKEEAYLFKEMTDELGEMGKNLVQHGMLVEHDLARMYVGKLEAATKAYAKKPDVSHKLDMIIYSGAYADLLERHISKENAVVFTFAERQLSAEAKDRVEEDMAAFESDEANAEVREKQLSILGELEEKYL